MGSVEWEIPQGDKDSVDVPWLNDSDVQPTNLIAVDIVFYR
jgi:hypothetical protein